MTLPPNIPLRLEEMLPEQRVITNMYFRGYSSKEILYYLGRNGIRYKGKTIRDSKAIPWLIQDIIKEYRNDKA